MEHFKQSEIESHFHDYLTDCHAGADLSDLDPGDLHHEAFNQDYYIIGTYKAAQWLGDHAFECIEIIKDYEQDNFGEVYTDFSSPEAVVNMYTYIVGEEIVYEFFNSLDSISNRKDK